MRRSDVLVSSSSMETYGMALAEARALGLPIVATRGGNVESLVDPRAGGAVFDDTDAVAEELVRLAKDSDELERRRRLAAEMRLVRSWDEAAADFLSLFGNEER
jgi:glycosyltransferase involved in cell wall biosynthesis